MKRRLFLGLSMMLLLILILFSACGEKGGTGSISGKVGQNVVGIIKLPDGTKATVKYNGPPELPVQWHELDVIYGQLHLKGTLTNTSETSVKFSEIVFVLDGAPAASIWYQAREFRWGEEPGGIKLKQGEKMVIEKGFPPGISDKDKTVEIVIKGFEKIGNPRTEIKEMTASP